MNTVNTTTQYLGRYGIRVRQYFESAGRLHYHEVARRHYIVGDGSTILRVLKPQRRLPEGGIWKITPNSPEEYAGYFLPEEMENPI